MTSELEQPVADQAPLIERVTDYDRAHLVTYLRLLDAARDWNIDLSASVMIGDRGRDVGAGRNAGCRTIFIDRGYAESLRDTPDLIATDLADAVDKLLGSLSTPRGNTP